MREIILSERAFADYNSWALEDKKTFKKIVRLIKELKRDPFKGIGQPEPLRFSKQGYWSRRINQEDRLVYAVEEKYIYIASCKGHYDD